MSYALSVNVREIAAREKKSGNDELAAILDGLAIAIENQRAEIEQLRTALLRYGIHTWDCPSNDRPGDQPCTCGWDDTRRALEEK